MYNAFFAVLLLAVSTPAAAHGALGEGSSFWSGVFHFFVSPLSIVAVAGLVAALTVGSIGSIGRPELPFLAFAISGLCGFLSARFPIHGAALAAAVGVVLVGISAASGHNAKQWLSPVLAALGGTAAGAAVELDTVTWGSASCVGVAIFYFTFVGVAAFQHLQTRPRLQAVMPIALRVVGAWVTAIGALLGALALRAVVALGSATLVTTINVLTFVS